MKHAGSIIILFLAIGEAGIFYICIPQPQKITVLVLLVACVTLMCTSALFLFWAEREKGRKVFHQGRAMQHVTREHREAHTGQASSHLRYQAWAAVACLVSVLATLAAFVMASVASTT